MRKFSICCLLSLLIITPGILYAQAKLKITGQVSDSSKALSMATVRIFKANTDVPLQVTLTKESGNFQLNKPVPGNYVLSFSHTGFTEKRVDLVVTAEQTDIQVPAVALSNSSATLKEVKVTASRPLIEQSDDKIVFNVEDDPATKSETAIDILRKTPFVSVDGEENIKVNGKSNFKVLLNGRETSMFARNVKEALRGFPGALISKIEVITAPSAKYDGEGIGGLINIITKKKVVGYNGTLSSFSRTSDKVNSFSLNGNAKFGKLGVSVMFHSGFSDPVLQYNTNFTIPTIKNIYAKRSLEGNQYSSSRWSYGNAELSWELDTLNTISLYTHVDSWSNKTVSDQVFTTEFVSSPSSTSYFDQTNNSRNPGINVGSDYIKRFKKNKEREFSIRFLGEFGKNDSKVNSIQDNPDIDRYLINNSYAVNNQYTLQVDNIIPLKKNRKIEGGVKAILRRASSDFQSMIKYDAATDYKINPNNTDYFEYQQDVMSVYSTYSFRHKKSSFRLGGRVEYTNVNGDFVTSQTKVKNSYATFLPNIQWTNKLTNTLTLVLNYTKRLQRPYIYDLNPFVFDNDSLNISYGNPDLAPQTSHAFMPQLRYNKGTTFAGLNLEASYSGNKIMQYSSFDPVTGITKTTSLNIGKEFQASVNLNINAKLTKKWSLFVNGSVRYIKVKNNANSEQQNSGIGCNFNMNTSYRFNPKFAISSFIGLWKEAQSIQTTYPFNAWHNVAFNYKIFKNKVNISLRAVNFLEKTRDFRNITKDQNFYSENMTRQFRRAAVLALTWNFGKLTEQVSKKKGVSNDDILTRPAAPTGN